MNGLIRLPVSLSVKVLQLSTFLRRRNVDTYGITSSMVYRPGFAVAAHFAASIEPFAKMSRVLARWMISIESPSVPKITR